MDNAQVKPGNTGNKSGWAPHKTGQKSVPQTSELGVPWGLFPGKVLSTVTKKTTNTITNVTKDGILASVPQCSGPRQVSFFIF